MILFIILVYGAAIGGLGYLSYTEYKKEYNKKPRSFYKIVLGE